jgi:branched-chain amino acid transport system ATP-binding protein
MSRPLLRIRRVEARYGPFVALQDVSLIVPEGAAVALLGPNGAGKSTLLRTVSGMLPATRGTITFDGRRIERLADHRIARMGLAHIPEGRGIFPGLSVRENLLMATQAARKSDRGMDRVFELFPILRERRDQEAGTLSGGEQQMLSLARAVVVQPRLLMLDELSLGLAPRLVTQLMNTVARIRDEGVSILLVEQYVTHALRLADIVVILHKGRVAFMGEPGELQKDERLVESYLGHAGTASYALAEGPPPAKPKKKKKQAAPRKRAGARKRA